MIFDKNLIISLLSSRQVRNKFAKMNISSNKISNCYISITLDKRSNRKSDEYPLSVCFNLRENNKQKRYYHHIDEYYTEKYFNDVVSTTASRSPRLSVRKRWEALLEEYREKIIKLSKSHPALSIELVKNCISGQAIDGETGTSFLKVWEAVIASRREEGGQ